MEFPGEPFSTQYNLDFGFVIWTEFWTQLGLGLDNTFKTSWNLATRSISNNLRKWVKYNTQT